MAWYGNNSIPDTFFSIADSDDAFVLQIFQTHLDTSVCKKQGQRAKLTRWTISPLFVAQEKKTPRLQMF